MVHMANLLHQSSLVALQLLLLLASWQLLQVTDRAVRSPCNDTVQRQRASEHKSRIHRMNLRLARVRKTCQLNGTEIVEISREFFDISPDQSFDESVLRNPDVLVARQQNIAWCKVPKVASTSLVQSLHRVIGRSDLLATLGRSHQHSRLRLLMPHLRPGEFLPDITSFLIVRHPFDRILSAYRDKITNKDDEEAPHMFRKFRATYNLPIIEKFRLAPPPDPFFEDVPTFPEFVDYLVDTPISQYNEHWRPYFLTCTPCHHHYSVILKLETLHEDSQFLVELTGFPDLKPSQTHTTKATNEDSEFHEIKIANESMEHNQDPSRNLNHTVFYYSQVHKEKLHELFEKYKIDFDMFEYDPSPFFELTSQ